MAARAVCDQCGQACITGQITTGYGTDPETGDRLCFRCCGIADAEQMIESGRATLYLGSGQVTNWPGSLCFDVGEPRQGRDNIAGTRYDVWFRGPAGQAWWGVQYGEWTQLCHCRRLQSGGIASRDVLGSL